ncbi:MAG: alpha-L-fucosidase [Tepidisphaeraceae bacterium]|jgi:alpha-L-fucosidase
MRRSLSIVVTMLVAFPLWAHDPKPLTPLAEGPFKPNRDSLKQYRCPDLFRDAKLRIWAVWGPECVPEQGDWYARNPYIPGSHQYEYNLETCGHPSKFGYKDIIPLWKAVNSEHHHKSAAPR